MASFGAVVSTRAVRAEVPSSTVLQTQYRCRLSFFTGHSHVDLATNRPDAFEGMCYLPRTFIDTRSASDSSANNTANTTSAGHNRQDTAARGKTAGYTGIVVNIVILYVLLILVVGLLVWLFARRRLRGCNRLQSTGRRCCGDIASDHCGCDDTSDHGGLQVSHDDAITDRDPADDVPLHDADHADSPEHNNNAAIV